MLYSNILLVWNFNFSPLMLFYFVISKKTFSRLDSCLFKVRMVKLLRTANLKIRGRRSISPPVNIHFFSENDCISIISFISCNLSDWMPLHNGLFNKISNQNKGWELASFSQIILIRRFKLKEIGFATNLLVNGS